MTFSRDFLSMTQPSALSKHKQGCQRSGCSSRRGAGAPGLPVLLCQMVEGTRFFIPVLLARHIPKSPLVRPPTQLGKLRGRARQARCWRGERKRGVQWRGEEGRACEAVHYSEKDPSSIMAAHSLLIGTTDCEFLLMKMTYTWHRKHK